MLAQSRIPEEVIAQRYMALNGCKDHPHGSHQESHEEDEDSEAAKDHGAQNYGTDRFSI